MEDKDEDESEEGDEDEEESEEGDEDESEEGQESTNRIPARMSLFMRSGLSACSF